MGSYILAEEPGRVIASHSVERKDAQCPGTLVGSGEVLAEMVVVRLRKWPGLTWPPPPSGDWYCLCWQMGVANF